jgi:hypothetical protein
VRKVLLFDELMRDDLQASSNSEPPFSYLNRSARPEAQRVRALLEEWFMYFPEFRKCEVRSRFRSEREDQHLGGFFELYCAALLHSQGFAIEFEPTADPSKKTRPDFMAVGSGGMAFYLESTLVMGPGSDTTIDKKIGEIYDKINQVSSPNFNFFADIECVSSDNPKLSELSRFVSEWLNGLIVDKEVQHERPFELDAYPRTEWSNSGWKVRISAIPKNDRKCNSGSQRPLKLWGGRSYDDINLRSSLLNALKSKSTHYGSLDWPFVIAVNVVPGITDLGVTVDDALKFFWSGPNGPQNQRVSAVLVARHLNPWSPAWKTPILWHNPWAAKPLSPQVWQGPQMIYDPRNSNMELREGKDAYEMLGLCPGWPEAEPGSQC